MTVDLINSPPHYKGARWESIEIIEALGNQFRLGNALKYIFRHQKKNGVEDLHKARWYLERELAAERMPHCRAFDVRFYEQNARFFAESFGITDVSLINAVAGINGASAAVFYAVESEWRANVRYAINHLNDYLRGLGEIGGAA